jgi:N-sulfoglucosamine sulfohydrolase
MPCRIVLLWCVVLISIDVAMAQRNVVLLVSDNQNKSDCGCYGNQIVQTPNIDRLARQGVRFLDAFATTASCGPSRAVIYSGLQTHSNGQYGHGHGIHTFRLSPNVQTVFALLGENGYHTTLLGKQHTTHAESYPYTFNTTVSGRDITRITEFARQFIEEAADEPFFLVIGYSDPHPTSRERPGWGIVRHDASVPVVPYDPAELVVPDYLPDRPEVREGLAGYYQQISRLDHGIGQILDLLRQAKKEQETLVIFTSDHGSSEPGAMANHYEPGVQVPLIVKHPQLSQPGTTSRALVTLADITPTILEWTGTKLPKTALHGRSVLPILEDPNPAGWDEVYLSHVCHEVTMYYPMRTYRNRRYKLIWNLNWRSEYPLPIDTLQRATWTEAIRRGDPFIGRRSINKYLFRDAIELYDLQSDPDEIKNLADDPAHAQLRKVLSERLQRWMEQTQDPWLVRHRLPMPGDPESSDSRQTQLGD